MNQQNEPSFMRGFRNAKKILLQLRAKKVTEQQVDRAAITPNKNTHQEEESKHEELEKQQKMKQVLKEVTFNKKSENLHMKINEIGEQLYDCHNECESYESIFNNLAQYYAQKLSTIELNDKLKRKSFELKQLIGQYRNKIKNNQQKIDCSLKETEQCKIVIKQHLYDYLRGQAQKSNETPHQKIPFRHKISEYQGLKQQKQQVQFKLNLNYGSLKKQVARKPMVKKQTMEEDELRRPFYSSELYSL